MNHQPNIVRKRVVRLTVGVVLIATLVYLFIQFVSGARSADPGDFQSAGFIAATQEVGDGEQVVLIDPKGEIVKSPGYTDDATDQPPVWSPDGQRLYFASDRENDESHLFRWNPARQLVERRSVDKRAKSWIYFDDEPSNPRPTLMMGASGTVMIVEPRVPHSRQIMPPRGKSEGSSSGESGATGVFEQTYSGIGTSVKMARWSADRSYILAVMRRDDGEILVAQKTFKDDHPVDLTDTWKVDVTKPPTLVIAGDRVDFDINKKTGKVVYACQNFKFPDPAMIPPEMKQNGRVMLPFRHVLGIFSPGDGGMYEVSPTAQNFIAVTEDDKFCFAVPVLSPDGSQVVCQMGDYRGAGVVQVHNLVLMPVEVGGGQQSRTLVSDPVIDVSWHPNGQSILFSADANGERSIFSIKTDKTDLKNLTKGKGKFRGAVWSPATK